MLRRARSTASLCLLAALAVIVLSCNSCGKKDDNKDSGIPQNDADAIAQMLAAMTGANNGGWFTEVQSTWDAHPWPPAPAPLARGARTEHAGGLLGRDTSFTRGSMSWNLVYTYFDDANTPSPVYNSTTTARIQMLSTALGTVPAPAFNGYSGTAHYGHVNDTLTVTDLGALRVDFLGFDKLDTAFVTLTGSAGTRYFYVDENTTLEYELLMRKGGTPYPDSGSCEIDAFITELNSPGRNDHKGSIGISMVVVFDGTQAPHMYLSENVPDPTKVFDYRLNLLTGAVAPYGVKFGALPRTNLRARRITAP